MDFSDKSDNALMKEFASCSRIAYETVANRYKKRLFNFLLKGIIKDRDVAEDLVQQTLIKVYESKFIYRTSHQFSTWIYTICRNLALNEIRNKRTVSISSYDEESEPAGGSDPVDGIEGKEMSGIITIALNKLDDKYREVIVLRFLEELSYEEISGITGKSINTLKSLCKRGLEKFKYELEKMKFQ